MYDALCIATDKDDGGKLTDYLKNFADTVYNVAEFGVGTNKLINNYE
jgi:hypothetical protein